MIYSNHLCGDRFQVPNNNGIDIYNPSTPHLWQAWFLHVSPKQPIQVWPTLENWDENQDLNQQLSRKPVKEQVNLLSIPPLWAQDSVLSARPRGRESSEPFLGRGLWPDLPQGAA